VSRAFAQQLQLRLLVAGHGDREGLCSKGFHAVAGAPAGVFGAERELCAQRRDVLGADQQRTKIKSLQPSL
jgi:hypothetical protein